MNAFFVSDLHGRRQHYSKLLQAIAARRPQAVFCGGDLLPSRFGADPSWGEDFSRQWLLPQLERLQRTLGADYPRWFVILGNDDPRSEEAALIEAAAAGLLDYVHGRWADWSGRRVYGYACVPPTPFLLKDWERYDVSRFADPGAVSPEEGWRTVPIDEREARLGTIQQDLESLAGGDDLAEALLLFHAPPYQTQLDRAALDGKTIDGCPLDVHVGSIAVRRFIEARQPLVTLHGHVHESARLTGAWRDQIGRTHLLGAAHDGPELAVVCFDPDRPRDARRELL